MSQGIFVCQNGLVSEMLPPLLPEVIAAPKPPRDSPLRFWGALGLIALFVLFQVLAIIPFAIVDALRHTSIATHPAVLALATMVAGAGIVCLAISRYGRSLSGILGPWDVPPRMLPSAAVCIAGNMFIVVGITTLAAGFSPIVGKLGSQLNQTFGVGVTPIAAFFLMVVAAPLTEETVMRGVILQGLLGSYSRRKAIALGAILFAIAHITPVQFATALITGVLFGWWFTELQSIWFGALAHALNNTVAFAALLAVRNVQHGTSAPLGWTYSIGIIFVGASLLYAGVQGCRRVLQTRRAANAVEITLPVGVGE